MRSDSRQGFKGNWLVESRAVQKPKLQAGKHRWVLLPSPLAPSCSVFAVSLDSEVTRVVRHHSRLLFPARLLFQPASWQLRRPLPGKQAASGGVALPRLPANFTSQRVSMATPPQRTPAGSCACVVQADKWTEREQAERGSNSLISPPPPPPWSSYSSFSSIACRPSSQTGCSWAQLSPFPRPTAPFFCVRLYLFGWLVDLPSAPTRGSPSLPSLLSSTKPGSFSKWPITDNT